MKRDRKNDCKSSHYFHIPKYKKTVKMLTQRDTNSPENEENTLKKLLKNITYEKTMIIFKKNKYIYIYI